VHPGFHASRQAASRPRLLEAEPEAIVRGRCSLALAPAPARAGDRTRDLRAGAFTATNRDAALSTCSIAPRAASKGVLESKTGAPPRDGDCVPRCGEADVRRRTSRHPRAERRSGPRMRDIHGRDERIAEGDERGGRRVFSRSRRHTVNSISASVFSKLGSIQIAVSGSGRRLEGAITKMAASCSCDAGRISVLVRLRYRYGYSTCRPLKAFGRHTRRLLRGLPRP